MGLTNDMKTGFRTALGQTLGTIVDPFEDIYMQNTLVDLTNIQKYIIVIWDKSHKSVGTGGDKTWHYTIVLECFYKSSTDINVDNQQLYDDWIDEIETALDNRYFYDLLLQNNSIKYMETTSSVNNPFMADSPELYQRIITLNGYIHNTNTM